MAVGATVSSRDSKVQRGFDNTPAPAGKYKAKLDLSKMEVAKSKQFPTNPGYINGVRLKLQLPEDKTKMVFHRLFLSMKPTKNGTRPIDFGGALMDLAQALQPMGADFPSYIVEEVKREVKDGNTTREETEKNVPYVDAQAVIDFLKSYDGAELEVQVKVVKNTYNGKTEDKNEVDYFFPLEAPAPGSDSPFPE